jgi:DNA-binding MarR family transcriptional regulator
MDDLACKVWLRHWQRAMRWRRRVERDLRSLELTLAQWLVLDAMSTLFGETNDAVSQIQVARRLEMDKATLSQVMNGLDRRGLVDRGLSFPGPECRIYLTRIGAKLAARGRAVIAAASAAEDSAAGY